MDELVDELPKPKQVNFVKHPVYENLALDAEIDRTEQEIQAMDETCVKRKKASHESFCEFSEQLVRRSLRCQLARQNETYEKFMNEKNKYKIVDQQKSLMEFQKNKYKMDNLKKDLYKSQNRLYSIRSLHFRLLCGRNKLTEEKQLLGEIKQLKATREKLIGTIDSIKEQRTTKTWKEDFCRCEDDRLRFELGRKIFRYQITLKEMNDVRLKSEKRAITENISYLEMELNHLPVEISTLERKLSMIGRTMKAEQRRLKELKRERYKRYSTSFLFLPVYYFTWL
ncbi:hypothetical protein MKX01_018100 [Papaver californicum]|nr:hypothetical protein MKX01_018100 [Papaver californicum]